MQKNTFRSATVTRLAIISLAMITGCCVPPAKKTDSAQRPVPAQPAQAVTAPQPPAAPPQPAKTSLQPTEISRAELNSRYPRQPDPLLRHGLPLTGFISDHFTGSGKCANCHDLLEDAKGNNVSISDHWRSTMMANAAKDPIWQAKVASEGARNPAIKAVIEEKCSLCHMPMAYTEAKRKGQTPSVFEPGFLFGRNQLHVAAMDGVSCTLCHQIQDEKLGTKDSFSGKFTVDTTAKSPGRLIFGPYRAPRVESMRDSVGYTPAFGSHTNDSALCATCHTLYTPYLDGKGNIAGEFPEQTPYLEWLHSDFATPPGQRHEIGESSSKSGGRICQECHMPHTETGKVSIARYAPPGTAKQDHFSQHFFVGGNVPMLEMMRDNSASLGISAGDGEINATIDRTMKQLQTETAAVTIANATMSGNSLSFEIKVNSKVGHKFPTGFPSRRAWLHLAVADSRGAVIFESGKPLPNGTIAGNDNDSDPDRFEPHHDTIASPDQVQIYETIMANTDGQVTYTLLRSASYLKDNRLLPQGFDKASAKPDIAVYGDAAKDADFIGGSDTVRYAVNTTGAAGPFTVAVELLYSPLSHAFMQDLLLDDHLEPVRDFGRMAGKTNLMPVPVAAAGAVIR